MKATSYKNQLLKAIFIGIAVGYGALLNKSLQAQNATIGIAEMKRLSGWVGQWKGEGWSYDQARQRHEFTVEETIQSKLDGRVILAEGIGKNRSDGTVGFHALGLIYYHAEKQTYEIKSLLAEGMTTLAQAGFNEKGQFEWGFDVPNGRIRYTITLTNDTWHERGEFSTDQKTWYPIMEMNLNRVK